jgi:hypothetical protein
MHTKLEVHDNFVAMIVIGLALSVGFHSYTRHQYNEPFLENTAMIWETLDIDTNQPLNRRNQ